MIKKTKTGYTARVYYKESGKRTSLSKTFIKKRLAQDWENEMMANIQVYGSPNNDSELKFVDYFWEWFETYRKETSAPATVDRYKTTYNTLVKYIGDERLTSMTRMKYQQFLNDYGQNHAKASASKINNAVRSAVNYAIDDGLITKDFTHHITLVGNDSTEEAKKFLNMADTERLMSSLSNATDVYSISRPMIYTALLTGMRLAEVQGLTEDCFFPKFHRIQIKRTYAQKGANIDNPFKPTKNKSSMRVIDIPIVLVNFLNELLETQHKFNHHENKHHFIFMNTRGDIPSSNAVNKVLARELKKINAKKIISFHGLRHTHASYLLAKGSKIEYVSKRLGHASIETTLKTYAHLLEETESNEIEKAMNFFDSPAPISKRETR